MTIFMNKKIFLIHAESERIIRHVHIIAKSGVYLRVRLPVACISAAPTGRIPRNLILGNLYENLLRKSQFDLNRTRI